MRLIAVSVVKNDADIIEPFVRHTRTWVDHHLIFDHASTDGTREILGALQREGLPLTLFTDDALGNLQQFRTNHLIRLATRHHGADWVLVLDADEILAGPGRSALAALLAEKSSSRPVSLPLLNYYRTKDDDPSIANPARRLNYCQAAPSSTRKLFIPRALAENPAAGTGMGNHVFSVDGQPVTDEPLPPNYWLAHLSQRSAGQQVMRVIVAELQKISGGVRQTGLALHYRLGFQLLAEHPELFLDVTCPASANLKFRAIDYAGGELRYSTQGTEWTRLSRAILPYLEKLAVSHGALLDQAGPAAVANTPAETVIRLLSPGELQPSALGAAGSPFSGFVAEQGWGAREGPVPEAFLPPFHWGYAPFTRLVIESAGAVPAMLDADVLTYSEGQSLVVELNGSPVGQLAFPRINQKEHLSAQLPLQTGRNELVLRYGRSLVTDHDPRALAVIFLSLQIRKAGQA